jgi:hypothetical protein
MVEVAAVAVSMGRAPELPLRAVAAVAARTAPS